MGFRCVYRPSGQPPIVTNVSISGSDSFYETGQTVPVAVEFDQAVTVNTTGGTPTLELETGATDRSANYVSGSGSTTLVFNYVVQAGDDSTDLDYKAIDSLSLNGGSIHQLGNTDLNAHLLFGDPGTSGSIAANESVRINTFCSHFN